MRAHRYAVIVLALIMLATVGSAALNLESVVLALSFDEGEGVVAHDGTENMNDGTLVMEADWRDGKIGSSVRLKDQAHVEIQPSESLNLGGTDFSMALWMSFSDKTGWTTLMTHNDGANLGAKKWAWWHQGGRFRFHTDNADGDPAWANGDFLDDPVIDQWYHLAVVKLGNVYSHYLDGEPFGVDQMFDKIPNDIPLPMTIGNTAERYFFQGRMDEVIITKEALSQAQVRDHMAAGNQAALAVQPEGHVAVAWGGLKAGRQ